MLPFDGKYMSSYLMEKVTLAVSLAIYKIFVNLIKYRKQKFDIENGSQGQVLEKLNLRHSSGNVRFHIADFFSSKF